MKAVQDIVTRQIVDETVLIPVGELSIKLSGMISLNETGGFVWKMLSTSQTKAQIMSALLSEYRVDANMVADDLHDLLSQMTELFIVEEDENDFCDDKLILDNYNSTGEKLYIKPELVYETYIMSNCIASSCSVDFSKDLGLEDGEELSDGNWEDICITNGGDSFNIYNS
jgi:hypothetical protein